jgi:hypothetical protein
MKPGAYKFTVTTLKSQKYPNGTTETGTRRVENTKEGQKWTADATLSYTDASKKKVSKKISYDARFFLDFDGKTLVVYTGYPGSILGTVTTAADGGFTIEGTKKSNVFGKDVEVKIDYKPIASGYEMHAYHYDEAAQSWLEYRSGNFIIQK